MSDQPIRRATLADIAGLAACIDAAYAHYRATIPDLPEVSRGLAGDIADHHVWVALADGTIAGGVVLHVSGVGAHLANLALHPGWQGKGLGRSLIAKAEGFARSQGCQSLSLGVYIFN
ncbi:MAG: GNAT family N-acetyltransferase [Albidovulum sp.]